jgi:hypothetical protein
LKQNNVVYPNPCFLLGATIDKTLFYAVLNEMGGWWVKLNACMCAF